MNESNNQERVKGSWNEFAPVYTIIDPTANVFFSTLLNLLEISESKHILEIGCVTGSYLHMVMNLKPSSCMYLATDLSSMLIELSKNNLRTALIKMGFD